MVIDLAETPTVIQAGERTFVRQAVDNMGWVDMGDFLLVVDALEQRRLEGEVMEAIGHSVGDKPVRYVLNTHTHGDHTALNRAFRKRFGAKIVNWKTSRIPAEGELFAGTDMTVRMFHLPGCHTREDCIVWVETDRVLFVGDIFGWGLIPPNGNIAPGQARVILDTFARLIDFDARVVVPGHGPVCTTEELRRWVEYFRWLAKEIAERLAGGMSDSRIIEEIHPPDDMRGWWRFGEWKHADSVRKALCAARKGRLDI